MDEAIAAERGGFETRAELVGEAVENQLSEMEFPEAAATISERDEPGSKLPDQERHELSLPDLSATALRAPAQVPCLASDERDTPGDGSPMLGLHNRDYVSIWALHRLMRYTAESPIKFDDYLDRVTRAAWYFGTGLQRLESEGAGRKLTVLFPTNAAKRPSAERGFQSFAIGGLVGRDDQTVAGTGPLFAWRATQVAASSAGVTVALTDVGLQLIRKLDGLSLELPHPTELTELFLSHLTEHAPQDRRGFDLLIRAAEETPDRARLVQSFAAEYPEWTIATVSSVVQGYVARSREWGLLEPSLVDGRYWLTDIGRKFARESN